MDDRFLWGLVEALELPRDYLDPFESYRYMNQPLFWDWVLGDGRWDHAKGWVFLHLPKEEWQNRAHQPSSVCK